jgi:ADP-ribose pyrophosphatase YjhB (NUDIX family)
MVQLFIFNSDSAVLLLQRRETEPFYPSFWELPIGKVQPTDATLPTAAVRICKEKTGLDVTEVSGAAERFNDDVTGERCLQVTFTVKVAHTASVSPSDKHQSSTWCSEENIESIRMGAVTKNVVAFGFAVLDAAGKESYEFLSPA